MPVVKSPSNLSAALAADAALAAYLRTLAEHRAAELAARVPESTTTRCWSAAPLERSQYQRVVPLREARVVRIAVNGGAEPRAAQTRQAR